MFTPVLLLSLGTGCARLGPPPPVATIEAPAPLGAALVYQVGFT